MRPFREISAYKMSTDHGKQWKFVAICDACKKTAEPPMLLQPQGQSSVRSCEWCGALNQLDAPKGKKTKDLSDKDFVEQWKIDGFNHAIGRTIFGGSRLRRVEPVENEDLPTECVMLDIAYSPVIPISGGSLDDAVDVEKINDFTYRFEYNYQQHEVSDEKLKEMRARYIVTKNRIEAEFMVRHNPEGSIWNTLGKHTLASMERK